MSTNSSALTAPNKKTKLSLASFFIKYAIYLILLALVIVLSFATDKFLTVSNVISILKQISIQSIVAIGMTMIVLLGQIDLSVGSVVAFSGIISAMLMKSGMPIPLAILVSTLLSCVIGLVSGIVTAKYKVHAFLVTLATQTAVRGMDYIISGGYPVSSLPKSFMQIGGGYLGIIPVPVIIMLVFYAVFIFILNSTTFGRSIYAVGGNAESSRLSGINVEKIKVIVFVVTAALASVGGVILSSRLMSGAPDTGTGWEMDCITGVIIGGTSMFGGEGTLQGTFIGMLFVGVLSNGMVLLGINPYMQQVIKGLVILAAVILNSYKRKD
jgi:ribose transport system permease protein